MLRTNVVYITTGIGTGLKVSHESKKCPSDLTRQEKLGHWSQAEFLEPVLFPGGEGLISAVTPRVKDVQKAISRRKLK